MGTACASESSSDRFCHGDSARRLSRWSEPAVPEPINRVIPQVSNLYHVNEGCAPPLLVADGNGEKRFEPGDPEALDHLEEHGYVVFKEVLNPREVEHAVILFWKWLTEYTAGRICRGRPETWGGSAWPGNPANGNFVAGGLGQSPFMWHVRLRPRVLRAFAGIWKLESVDDLLMSFDGACVFRPTEVDPSWRTRGNWFHVDQNGLSTGSDRECVQGFVTLLDSNADTGGLAVLPGSHRHHAELFQRWQGSLDPDSDFFAVPQGEPLLQGDNAIRPRLICAKAGDLVLWDSRCIHCNVPKPHLLDSVRLDAALAEAGLSAAIAPLCGGLISVADAVWLFHYLSGPVSSGDIHARLVQWGVPVEVLHPLVAQLKLWADHLDDCRHAQSAGRESSALLPAPVNQSRLRKEMTAPSLGHLLSSFNGDRDLQYLVAYVCAMPRWKASSQMRRRRQQGLLLGATTTHRPHRLEIVDAARGAAAIMNPFDMPSLALRLAGCDGLNLADMHKELEETQSHLYGLNQQTSLGHFKCMI